MRFTSLVVELIRARPRLVVWLVVLLQAGLWLILPLLLYRSPPGDVATLLAFGREYQVGTDLGPPLASWLADIAFRAAGNHVFGVYLLGADLYRRYVSDLLSTGARDRRRAAGGACGAVVVDGRGLQRARRRVRPAGAGAPALGVAAAAFLAIARSKSTKRMVCLVDRSRPAAADDIFRDRAVAAAGRICPRHAQGAAHAEVARPAVCAARDRGAGLALSDLADPRRRAGHAVVACDIGTRCARHAMGYVAGGPWARDAGHPGAGGSEFCRGSSATPKKRRSSIVRPSIRWRASSSISLPSRRGCSEAWSGACSISTASWEARAWRC